MSYPAMNNVVMHSSIPVALCNIATYDRALLDQAVSSIFSALPMGALGGKRVLLKPNLVAASAYGNLACSQAEVVAAVARFFVGHGCRVGIGDSPAFGNPKRLMESCGILAALGSLPVEVMDFGRSRRVRLACGVRVRVAGAALSCDLLVNLPRVKTHVQMLVTLAVKNLFGTVAGWRKPWLHARLGDRGNRFPAMLVDLAALFPRTISLIDGIRAMEGEGPIRGRPVELGFLAASMDPVALDTAVLGIIGVAREESPLWRECARRGLAGCDPANLAFPLLSPADLEVPGIALPARLKPESFNPVRLAAGAAKRLAARFTS